MPSPLKGLCANINCLSKSIINVLFHGDFLIGPEGCASSWTRSAAFAIERKMRPTLVVFFLPTLSFGN